ncbi:putative transcription factor interactor and regulator CCHC(Zn) family [Rosa chinensis]|nr:putative transcription factor interactor and regulator CCHC(Zn) family [Rosa chinensis]
MGSARRALWQYPNSLLPDLKIQWNNMCRGGRTMRRGSSSNPPREYPQRGQPAPQMKGGNHNDMCYRCGSIEHWLKQCHTST